MSVRAFELSVGVSNGYVKNFKGSMGADKLERVFSEYPQLNPQWLLSGEGPMIKRKEPIANAEAVIDPEIVYLPIVPFTARAGYLGEYEQLFSEDAAQKQPVIVTKQMHGTYLCFAVGGDSMDPVLLHGDVVLARHISPDLYHTSRLHLRRWSVWIIVTRSEGILIKHITEHDVERGLLTLHSANPLYPDTTVHMSDVIDIYNGIEIVSRHL